MVVGKVPALGVGAGLEGVRFAFMARPQVSERLATEISDPPFDDSQFAHTAVTKGVFLAKCLPLPA